MKKIFFVMIMAASTLLASTAPNMKETHKELFEKIKSYKQENILPAMKEYKQYLDSKLTSDDLKQLNALRNEAKAMKEAKKAEIAKKIAESKPQNREDFKQLFKGEFKDNMAEMKPIFEKLKPIAERNMTILKEIEAKIEPKKETWKAGVKNIVDSWAASHQSDFDEHTKARVHERMGQFHGFMDDKNPHPMLKKMMAAKFMLWDGTDEEFLDEHPHPAMGEMMGQNRINDAGSFIPQNIVTPNPSTGVFNLKFNLKESANTRIVVTDMNGKNVLQLANQYSKGDNQINLNFSDYNLPSGTYYYNIQSGDQVYTGKMLYTK